jgi:hypothetical protein
MNYLGWTEKVKQSFISPQKYPMDELCETSKEWKGDNTFPTFACIYVSIDYHIDT